MNRISTLPCLLAAAVFVPAGFASTLHWDGGAAGGNSNMSTGTNWVEDTAPATGDDLVISGRNGTGTIPTLLTGTDLESRSMSFDNTAAQYGSNGLRIGPTTSTSSSSTWKITFNTADYTILSATNAANVTFWRYPTNTGGATLDITLDYTGYGTVSVDGTSSITFDDVDIGGTGGLIKTGAGTLTFANSNNGFSGGLTVLEGTVAIDFAGELGNATTTNVNAVILNGGTLQVTGGTTASSANRGFRVGASGGTISVDSGVTFRVQGSIRDVIGEAGSLTKAGAGTLSLEGSTYSFTGGATVSGGTLVLNGSNISGSGLDLQSGALLVGYGTIAGASTFASGSSITLATTAGGVITGAVGTLTFWGDLDISGAASSPVASFNFDLGSASYDQIVLIGSAVLNIGAGLLDLDDFNLNLLEDFGVGTYDLISTSQTVVGTFGSNVSGTIGGYNVLLTFGDSGDSIALIVTSSAIPEPSVCAALAGLGVLGLALGRRRSRA